MAPDARELIQDKFGYIRSNGACCKASMQSLHGFIRFFPVVFIAE